MDSELYPNMTFAQAMAIRMMGLDQLRESLKKWRRRGRLINWRNILSITIWIIALALVLWGRG